MLKMPPFYCREIETAAEREAVYRLRYAVYVDELGRRPIHADADARLLAEPLDRDAIALGAFSREGGELVGALRIHVIERAGLAAFPDFYARATAGEKGRFALVTRLVTRPESRGGGGSAGLALARAAHDRVLAAGVESAYIDCQAALEPFFGWLGFQVVDTFVDAEFGRIAVMRLRLEDLDRMDRSDSPLRRRLSSPTSSADLDCRAAG